MRRPAPSLVFFSLLCLLLAACGEAIAARTPTTIRPTATATRPIPTTTQPLRAAASLQPTSPAARPQPAVTNLPPSAASPRLATPVAPLPEGVVAIPDMGAKHVDVGQPLVLPHSPPSSGQHYPSALPGGIYRQEANPGNWIHSLEHGYVVALVKCTTDCNTIFNQLQMLYDTKLPDSKFGNVKFIATTYSEPFTNGESQIALVAWGYELLLLSYDADRILSFYNRFVDQGPELVP